MEMGHWRALAAFPPYSVIPIVWFNHVEPRMIDVIDQGCNGAPDERPRRPEGPRR